MTEIKTPFPPEHYYFRPIFQGFRLVRLSGLTSWKIGCRNSVGVLCVAPIRKPIGFTSR